MQEECSLKQAMGNHIVSDNILSLDFYLLKLYESIFVVELLGLEFFALSPQGTDKEMNSSVLVIASISKYLPRRLQSKLKWGTLHCNAHSFGVVKSTQVSVPCSSSGARKEAVGISCFQEA